MKRRKILIGSQAREQLAEGAKTLVEAVRGTLGPYGNNAFLDKHNKITNDGVTIAREIQLSDEVQNRGATAIREAGIKTDEEAGDGTTTAITLAWEIYSALADLLPEESVVRKVSPAELIKEVEKERKEITDKLMAMATPIETEEQLINSAKVSVEDEDLGKLIGQTQWKAGKNGRILVETSNDRVCSVEKINGILIDNGFGTSQVINNIEKQTLDVDDTATLLTTHTIRTPQEWMVIVDLANETAKNECKQLTVIARAWGDEAIQACVRSNNTAGSFKIWPLSAPYVDMQERMKDIQAVVGGVFYDSESSKLKDIKFIGLGKADQVRAKRYEATIAGFDDKDSQMRVAMRLQELKDKLAGSQSEFEKKAIGERLAQLDGGFYRLKVGASSDMECERIYDKCVDAVNAVRVAYQEGTVKGAGLAFKEISDKLPNDYILKTPICSIYQQIINSAPKDFIIEDWVRDPVKVLRVALERACSAASAFATADVVITEEFPSKLDELFKK